MGVSPDAFEAMGDMFGAAVGPAMHMSPADADGGDMGAIMMDAGSMMLPEGMDMPPAVGEAMMEMGQGMADAGCNCQDVGAEMMGDPGSATYLLPVDGDGAPVVSPGAPESCPAEACQSPPVDGAIASTNMMPPDGGYDHAPMGEEMMMPPPLTMEVAMEGGAVTGAMDQAFGAPVAPESATPAETTDAALGSAIDSSMDQGGAPATGTEQLVDTEVTVNDPTADMNDSQNDDGGMAG